MNAQGKRPARKLKRASKVIAVLLIAVSLLSMLWFSNIASSTEFHEESIKYLDGKDKSIMTIMAVTTATSAVISMMPDDIGTPIANELAEISSYFLIALCAVYLEKYLLTLTGFAAFKIIIPAACLIAAGGIFFRNDNAKRAAKKLAVFALALFLAVPCSVAISRLIENTYNIDLERMGQYVEEMTDEEVTAEDIEEAAEREGSGGILGLISGWGEKIAESFKTVTTGVSQKVKSAEQLLSNAIESLAVILVTSCIIPILVLLFLIWMVKTVFGIDLSVRRLGHGGRPQFPAGPSDRAPQGPGKGFELLAGEADSGGGTQV